ncbi:MAG: hypothetical protein ACLP1X_04280, partial [Polyangiaceae bacterium]
MAKIYSERVVRYGRERATQIALVGDRLHVRLIDTASKNVLIVFQFAHDDIRVLLRAVKAATSPGAQRVGTISPPGCKSFDVGAGSRNGEPAVLLRYEGADQPVRLIGAEHLA